MLALIYIGEHCCHDIDKGVNIRHPADLQVFWTRSYLLHLLRRVQHGADDHHSIQQVSWNPVWGADVLGAPGGQSAAALAAVVLAEEQVQQWRWSCWPDQTVSSVGCEDHDGSDGALQRSVEVREALDVQHVHLVHKEHAGHQLGHTLVDVAVHHLVDLRPQLVCNEKRDVTMRVWSRWWAEPAGTSPPPVISVFLGFISCPIMDRMSWPPWNQTNSRWRNSWGSDVHTATTATHLRSGVGDVQVVQRHVLDDLLLLVDVAFGQRHVLLRLQVELCRKSVAAALSLFTTQS